MKLLLAAFLVSLTSTAPQVPKDLAVKLTIKGCSRTSVIDTVAGTYTRMQDGKTWVVPAKLIPSERRWLDTLITESAVLGLPPLPPAPSMLREPAPTAYDLEITRDGQHRTFNFFQWPGASVPARLAPYERLEILAIDIERIYSAMIAVQRLPPSSFCI